MRGNPSGNSVPECEPRNRGHLRLSVLDVTNRRVDSAGSPRHSVTVLDLIGYTKTPGAMQAENQKSYLICIAR